MRSVTQAEATAPERVWTRQVAQRPVLVLTLGSGAAGGGEKEEKQAADLLVAFLLRCASASGGAASGAAGNDGGAVKLMVSGPTESVFPGTQERVRAIFARAFAQLLAAPPGTQ